MGCFGRKHKDDDSDDETVQVERASKLSYVGKAAYEVLRKKHSKHHKTLWNISSGEVVGPIMFTPKDAFTRDPDEDPPKSGHDVWLPETIGDVIARTEEWCDITELSPPDGPFMEHVKRGLAELCKRKTVINRIVIRMMFGNIVGFPVNCNQIMADLTKDLPPDANKKIRLWVGAWRKGTSWNHSKIVAVDGKYLWTGGHNWLEYHYLKHDPVVDMSVRLNGPVAVDAHFYANKQWSYIQRYQSTCRGHFIDQCISDGLDLPFKGRVSVTEFPCESSEFPPNYIRRKKHELKTERQKMMENECSDMKCVPVLTLGRQGTLFHKDRPSDDAFVAMIASTKSILRISQQDIGPLKVPGTKNCVPGLDWPKKTIKALAKIIWENDAHVEMALSNPNSIPGGQTIVNGEYGFGWTCVDVASEIIKRMRKMYPDGTDAMLRQKVQNNLRISYIRCPPGRTAYKSGTTIGLHTKHFIIDGMCAYIGSQNLYMSDLAEWGIAVDNYEAVQKMMNEYWNPMWKCSYNEDDCDVSAVMDGMRINRGPAKKSKLSKEQIEACKNVVHNHNRAGVTEDNPYHTEASTEEKRFGGIHGKHSHHLLHESKQERASSRSDESTHRDEMTHGSDEAK
eukprot:scaffold4703_cov108-Cylindrotheca_fusiformis.AAC.9